MKHKLHRPRLPQINHFYQSGQIGIIVLLIMTVILTIGLSIGNRTAQEQEITIEEEESTRVFNAAESGIERALSSIFSAEESGESVQQGLTTQNIDDTEIQYNVTAQENLETHLSQGSTAEIPLNADAGTQNLEINWWTNATDCGNDPASLLITVYSYISSDDNYTAKHFAVGPCNGAGERNDNYTNPSSSTLDSYAYFYELNLEADDQIVRIMPVYNDTQLRVSGPADVAQYSVTSQAKQANTDYVKAINVTRTMSSAPSFMDFALVSGDDLVK